MIIDYNTPISVTDRRVNKIVPGCVYELYYSKEAIRHVLNGDRRYVTYMFIWADTPAEFRNTWSPTQDKYSYDYNLPHTGKNLSQEQISFLRYLVREEEEKDKPEEDY